jgi:hypothetical protein
MLEVPDALLPLKMPNIVILFGSSEVFLDLEAAGFSEKLWVRNLEEIITK